MIQGFRGRETKTQMIQGFWVLMKRFNDFITSLGFELEEDHYAYITNELIIKDHFV